MLKKTNFFTRKSLLEKFDQFVRKDQNQIEIVSFVFILVSNEIHSFIINLI